MYKANKKYGRRAERGFSMIELLISITLFLVVTASIFGLMRVGMIDKNRSSRRDDMLKNARAGIHLIGRDALNAGLSFNNSGAMVPDGFIAATLGIPDNVDGKRDVLTSVIPGNNLNANDISTTGAKTDQVAFAYRDMQFNSGSLINLRDSVPATNPSILTLQTDKDQALAVVVNDLYLVESDTSQIAVMATAIPGSANNNTIEIAPGDPLNLNQKLDGAGNNRSLLVKCATPGESNCTTYLASLKRFKWVMYKVKQDGTLVKVVFGNNGAGNPQMQELPLAYNVQDFQVRYVLEDGTITDDPSAGPDGTAGTADDTPSRAQFVRQIMIRISVLADENDEQMGTAQTITLNATFATRNLEYDAG